MNERNTEQVWTLVDNHRKEFIGLADRVWEMPELGYQEHRSAAEHVAMLEQQGFRVTTGVAGIPTAIIGEAGDEGPVIAILGAQIRRATYAIGTPGHSWQLTAQGKTGIAHKGMVHAAKVMAATAVEALRDPELLARAKADFAARTDGNPYVCPLRDDVEPALGMALGT